jgi:CheY-like chemotaxis protein
LQSLQRAGNLLVAGIRGILDFSRIEAGSFDLHPAPVDLGALLARCISDLKILSVQRRVSLEVRNEEPSKTTIMFDEHCLSAALTNLLSHAINVTEGGLVSARLFRGDNSGLRIEVRCSGSSPSLARQLSVPPLPNEGDPSAVFDEVPFRVALARSYLRISHAGLSGDGAPGGPSVFTIDFPLGCELATNLSEVRRPALSLVSAPPDDSDSSRPVALVVDDDPASRLALRNLLGRRYRVFIASSAEEARRTLRDLDGTVSVIVDGLPPLGPDGGLALAHGLHQDTRYRGIPIVALMATGLPEDGRRAYAEECNAALSKPVNRVQLFATLERIQQQ